MSYVIRPANLADAPDLATCVTRAYAETAQRIPDLPDVADGLDEDITQHLVWVAESGGRILGGLVLILKPEEAKLANIAVDPDARGTGLGGRLIAVAEAACLERDIRVLVLNTHIGMPENVALYQHLGWQVTGQSGNTVFMSKTLTTREDCT